MQQVAGKLGRLTGRRTVRRNIERIGALAALCTGSNRQVGSLQKLDHRCRQTPGIHRSNKSQLTGAFRRNKAKGFGIKALNRHNFVACRRCNATRHMLAVPCRAKVQDHLVPLELTREKPRYLRSGLGSGMPAAMTAAMIMQTIPLSGKHMSSRPTTMTG